MGDRAERGGQQLRQGEKEEAEGVGEEAQGWAEEEDSLRRGEVGVGGPDRGAEREVGEGLSCLCLPQVAAVEPSLISFGSALSVFRPRAHICRRWHVVREGCRSGQRVLTKQVLWLARALLHITCAACLAVLWNRSLFSLLVLPQSL